MCYVTGNSSSPEILLNRRLLTLCASSGVPLREENTGLSGFAKGEASLNVTSLSTRYKGTPTVRLRALLFTVPRVSR